MKLLRIICALCLVLPAAIFGQTAKTRASLYTEIDSSLASGTQITATQLRGVFKNVVASAENGLTDGTGATQTWVAAAYQPLDTDLTAIAALATTSFGRGLLTETNAASIRSTIGAGTSNFDGVFASLTSKPTTLAGYGITDSITAVAAAAAYQPLDSDLTAIAALTTTSTGRSLLAAADAAAIRTISGAGTSSFDGVFSSLTSKPTTLSGYGISDAQPLDAALTALAAGSDFTQFTGPTTSTKVFTLPNASSTILTSNAAVTVPQGGTGLGTLTLNNVILGNGTSAPTFVAPGSSGNVLTSDGTTWNSAAPPTGTLPSQTGNNGKYLTTNGTATSWATVAGSGTVTNTGGNLTANALVLGAGTVDTKVAAGITTDGTSIVNLGVASTTAGKVKLFGGTSGDATIQTAAAAGTATIVTLPNASSTLPIFGQQITFAGPTAARTVTLPDAAFTVARTDAANTFTGASTTTSWTETTPVIAGGLTASGSGANTFAGSTGTFITSTGANTLSGATTINDATTPSLTTAAGKTNTGFVQVNGKTSGAIKILPADATGQTITITNAAQTTGATSLTIPDMAGAAGTFAFINKAQTFSATQTFTAPVLGAATATSINGLSLTSSTGTLTVANGKTLTASNTLTFAGTDGSTLNVGTGGTLGTAAYTASSAYEVPLTFSTGLTRSTNTVTVNTSQNIATLSNLTSNGFVKTSGGTGALSVDTATYLPTTQVGVKYVIQVACSDMTTAITAGTNKGYAPVPWTSTLDAIQVDVDTAPTGSTILVDVNKNGTTVISTKVMIDATETSSRTATTAYVFSGGAPTYTAGDIASFDFDQVGSTIAGKGVVATLFFTRQ